MRRVMASLLASGLVAGAAADFAAAQDATTAPKAAPPPAKAVPPIAPTATPTIIPLATPPEAAPLAANPAPSDAAPEPKPEAPKPPQAPKPPPEPLKRPRFNAAIMQGVDKITAETLRFEAKVGEPVRYKGLILNVRACETTASDEGIDDNVAYVDVQSQPELLPGRAAAPPRQVFKGWMFASSPTLHPFEHPVYDLWLIACRTAGPGA